VGFEKAKVVSAEKFLFVGLRSLGGSLNQVKIKIKALGRPPREEAEGKNWLLTETHLIICYLPILIPKK